MISTDAYIVFLSRNIFIILLVDCISLFKPLKGVDCRLDTCLRCRLVDRNLRLETKIVDFSFLEVDCRFLHYIKTISVNIVDVDFFEN